MDLRRTLGSFLEAVGTGRLILIGNSLGGALGMLQAAIEPRSLDGLVLNGSVYPIPVAGTTPVRVLRAARGRALPSPAVLAGFALYDRPWIGERLAGLRVSPRDAERAVRLSLRFVTADPASVPDEVVTSLANLVRDHADDPEAGAAFLRTARSLLSFLRRQDLQERVVAAVAAPTLVLHGRRDRLVPISWAEAALESRPDWRGRLFPDLGHVPQMEAPDRWADEVIDWFDATFPGRPAAAGQGDATAVRSSS